MYEKLLAVLWHCGNENVPCEGCPVHDECGNFDIGAARNMREAADAIEELQQTADHYKGCSDDWYKEACDYKAMLPRWISVTERLPEDGSLVGKLIADSDGNIRIASQYAEITLSGGKTVYTDLIDLVSLLAEDTPTTKWEDCTHITHWMPLPEPPKEGTK